MRHPGEHTRRGGRGRVGKQGWGGGKDAGREKTAASSSEEVQEVEENPQGCGERAAAPQKGG